MRFRSIRGIVFALATTLVMSAQASDGYINIEIVNDGENDQRIAVVDNICQQLVLERRIIADGLVPAQVCARKMDRGQVTIRNLETGAEREYRNVLDGDRLRIP